METTGGKLHEAYSESILHARPLFLYFFDGAAALPFPSGVRRGDYRTGARYT